VQKAYGQKDDKTSNRWQSEYREISSIWLDIKKDPDKRSLLERDLGALHGAGLIARISVPGKGPRGLALSPDGALLAVAAYFSGRVALIDTKEGKVAATVALGPQPEPDAVRRGETIFHDATHCFQSWLSCATCHPEGGRADGLNWDLLNDGIGNPKNTKSLLLSHKTPPVMAHGIRENMETAVRAGMKFIQFTVRPEEDAQAIDEYLKVLEPVPSPRRANGKLSDSAKRGEMVFRKADCAGCHPGPLYTDMKSYDVGIGTGTEAGLTFDTPTLIELWRTAPYLYDGRAVTMEEVLTKYNPEDKHGKTSHLSKQEIADLVEYLLSL
jgi:cytochrome c peroxidase